MYFCTHETVLYSYIQVLLRSGSGRIHIDTIDRIKDMKTHLFCIIWFLKHDIESDCVKMR